MRKHFLILMLLALLPLASFAGDITILPANLQYTWGNEDIPLAERTATVDMIAPVGQIPDGVSLQDVANALTFIPRTGTITKPGTYNYVLVTKTGYQTGNLAGHTIYISGGDGQIEILKTPLTENMITITDDGPFTFKNDIWKPACTVSGNGIAAKDYTLSYGGTIQVEDGTDLVEKTYDNIHVGADGKGVIIITAKEGDDCYFTGTAYKTFTIEPLALGNNITVADISDKTYSGGDIVPNLNITCTVGDNTNYELRSADFSAVYADNQNVGQATITIADKNGGDFTFDNKEVHFNIVPLSVKDNPAFEISGQVRKTYTGEELTQEGNGNLKVYWKKLADQDPVDVTEHFGFTCSNNVNVGMAAIKATAKPNDNTTEPAYVNNFKDDFSSTFAIIPQALNADGLHLQINLLKRNPAVEENDPNAWVEATYEYEGRAIKPGKIAADGKVVVTTGEEQTLRTLKENTDYVIVADGYANNKNASTGAAEEKKPVLKIKGIGNYDAVDTNGDPIVISKKFEINKRTLKFEAVTPITTSYGVEPKDTAYTDNIVEVEGVKEDIGGKITYKIYDNNGDAHTQVVKDEMHPNAYKELVVSTNRYTYIPVWKANPYPQAPAGGWTDENPAPDPANYDNASQVAARANYNIDAIDYTEGVIKVTNAVLYVVVDNLTKKYGSTDPRLTYKVHAGSAEGDVVATSTELPEGYWSVAPVLERTEGENVKKNAQDPTKYDGYTIAVTNKVAHDQVAAVAKDNYEINFVDGALTINPFPITVTANNQTILYGNQPNKETFFNSMVKTVNDAGEEVDGDQVTVIFSPAQTGNQQLIDRTVLNLKLKVASSCDGTVRTHKGVLVPSIENDNFIATPVPGDLTIKASNILVLKQDAEDLPGDIAAAAASRTAKTVKFGSRTLKADTWYTMVLPFTVKATELVNVMNDGAGNQVFTITNRLDKATKTGNIVFKLEMKEIPANEPFLIKTAEDVDLKDVVFSNKSIVYTTAAPESPAFDSNKLIGTYANIKIQCPAGSNMLKWLVNKETEKPSDPGTYYDVNNWKSPRDYEAPINALEAYLYENRTVPAANANAVHPTIITVEDFDGQTTSIKTLNAETMKAYAAEGWYTLDGIKLQSAPTEKGIYINNGKKVVLK